MTLMDIKKECYQYQRLVIRLELHVAWAQWVLKSREHHYTKAVNDDNNILFFMLPQEEKKKYCARSLFYTGNFWHCYRTEMCTFCDKVKVAEGITEGEKLWGNYWKGKHMADSCINNSVNADDWWPKVKQELTWLLSRAYDVMWLLSRAYVIVLKSLCDCSYHILVSSIQYWQIFNVARVWLL